MIVQIINILPAIMFVGGLLMIASMSPGMMLAGVGSIVFSIISAEENH